MKTTNKIQKYDTKKLLTTECILTVYSPLLIMIKKQFFQHVPVYYSTENHDQHVIPL